MNFIMLERIFLVLRIFRVGLKFLCWRFRNDKADRACLFSVVVRQPRFVFLVGLVDFEVERFTASFGRALRAKALYTTKSLLVRPEISFGTLLKHLSGDSVPHSYLGALMHGRKYVLVLSPDEIFRFLAHAEEA
jgi:hypothetical protein